MIYYIILYAIYNSVTETCKDGWYYDSKKKECLFFSEEKKNWYDAKQFCEDEFWGSMPVYRIISDAVFTKETAIREGKEQG